jgi:hypothetical protein
MIHGIPGTHAQTTQDPIGAAVTFGRSIRRNCLSLKYAPMAEALAHYRHYGIAIEDAMPRTFVAIEVRLGKVLDFRDRPVRQRMQVSWDRILSVDWRKEVAPGENQSRRRSDGRLRKLACQG